MLQRIATIAVFISCVSYVVCSPLNTNDLVISPPHVTKSIGNSARINCSDRLKRPLYWTHKSVRSSVISDIYFPGAGISSTYRKGGRHIVEEIDTIGACNLVIKNIVADDAGTYACRLDDGEQLEAELTVIESNPKCLSNISFDDVLVENDCDIEPDNIELNCNIAYYGNLAPVLRWFSSRNPDVSIPTDTVPLYGSEFSEATTTAVLRPTASFNGTNFVCTVGHEQMDQQDNYRCVTKNISVIYFFDSVESREIPTKEIDQGVNITCSANTSQQCRYRWSGTDMLSNNQIQIVGQTINLFKQNFQNLKCFADCRIRNNDCKTTPMLLHFTGIEDDTEDAKIESNNLTLVMIILVAILASVCLFVLLNWKFKFMKRAIRKCRMNDEIQEFDNAEQQPLNQKSAELSFVSEFISQNKQTIADVLQRDNRFAESLVSKSVLTNDEYSKLVKNWLPFYNRDPDQAMENLSTIFIEKINSRAMFNSFLASLIEYDDHCAFVNSYQEVKEKIRNNISKLADCLDTDNGLPELLLAKGLLTVEQQEMLSNSAWWATYQKQNRELLTNMLPSNVDSNSKSNSFLAALIENDQRHIFYFIRGSIFDSDIDNRILTNEEISGINKNMHSLTNLMDSNENFLDILWRGECLMQRHRDKINVQQAKCARNLALLAIIRRRSYADFKMFLQALKCTKQVQIIEMLQQRTGCGISIHAHIHTENGQEISSDKVHAIEESISNAVNIETRDSMTISDQFTLNSCVEELKTFGIKLNGASPTGSVIVYFSCETFQSIVAFKQMVTSGRMKSILEELFNRVVRLPIRLSLVVILNENEYRESAIEARSTIYSEESEEHGKCYFRDFPGELREIIFKKCAHINVNAELLSIFEKEQSCDGHTDSHNYERYFKQAPKNALENLNSVSYELFPSISPSKGRSMMKMFFRHLILRSRPMLVDRLNCGYVILNPLMERNIISERERQELDAMNRTLKKLPGDGRPKLTANKVLVNIFLEKNCSQFLELVKIMENLCLTHLLNHLISIQRLPMFGDNWPLEDKHQFSLDKHQEALSDLMDSLKDFANKTDAENFNPTSIQAAARHDTSVTNLSNLTNYLFDKRHMSVIHKIYFEKLPDPHSRNVEIIKWLRNGSMAAFESTVEYFKKTKQTKVWKCLMGLLNYPDLKLTKRIELKDEKLGVVGVAWLENVIYVVCEESKRVHVYRDGKPFDGLEERGVEINEMKKPEDMVADHVNRSILVSDSRSQCLWRIHLPGVKVTRWDLEAIPGRLSITPFDELLVPVEIYNRFSLRTYRMSDESMTESIQVPSQIGVINHAVQLQNTNFIISYNCCKKFSKPFMIGELSADGTKFVRTINTRWSMDGIQFDRFWPDHLAVAADGQIFVSDSDSDQIVLLDANLNTHHVLLRRKKREIGSPWRLCYLREKQQLIVGMWSPETISVFNILPLQLCQQ